MKILPAVDGSAFSDAAVEARIGSESATLSSVRGIGLLERRSLLRHDHGVCFLLLV
jgi:hypothetical protein